MNPRYRIDDTSDIISPAFIVFHDAILENIDHMIAIAGNPARLRPHCKTHKMKQVAELAVSRGITKHKAATFAEAEMLADAGAADVFLAYNMVGPNIDRAVRYRKRYPHVTFAVTADNPGPLEKLSAAMTAAGQTIDVLLDVDSGLHRTGLPAGDQAHDIYRRIAAGSGLNPGGFHVYDGHQRQPSKAERAAAVNAEWQKVVALRDALTTAGLPVPRIVAGGTPSFPIYAGMNDPSIECSPGTCVLHDTGYGTSFRDLEFVWAAFLLTRVVSRPTVDRVTVDLGSKAVASDPPAGERLFFPDLPDAEEVIHNEEHLVLKTPDAERFQPGDELLAVPRHICPTSASHKEAVVVENGKVVDRWEVIARDRWLTV